MLASHPKPSKEVVDLTADDDSDGFEPRVVERGVQRGARPGASDLRSPPLDTPHSAVVPPRKKRKSAKQEQIERAFNAYLESIDENEQIIVRRGFAKLSQEKESLLQERQQLKLGRGSLAIGLNGADVTAHLSAVEGALCQIDEFIVGIRQGAVPARDVPAVAKSAATIARGVRNRMETMARDRALGALQRQEGLESAQQLLGDPAYVDARARSLVTPHANTTSSRYAPSITPASANQIIYQQALNSRLNPGGLPDGSYIRQRDGPGLPFFNEPPGFNRRDPYEPDPSTEALVDLAKTDASPLEMPTQLNCTPLEHQKQGLGWLVRAERGRNKGSILADDMGLGKTVQTIALMYQNPPAASSDPNVRQVLIVCPVALIQTWADELRERVHEPHRLRVYVHHRGSNSERTYTRANEIRANADVVICTYHAVMNEYKQTIREHDRRPASAHPLFDMRWYRVVLDEAHAIKNRNSQVSVACAHLHAVHRLALTGTPMQNRIDELFPLVRFLRIAPYGDSWGDFKALTPMSHDPGTHRFESQKALAAFLSAVMLRRLKNTVINGRQIIDNLPEKHMKDIYVDMEADEYSSYKALEARVSAEVKRLTERPQQSLSITESQLNYSNMLVMLLRLRQAACHPLLTAITKKGRDSQMWGNNGRTKEEIRIARHIAGSVTEIALSGSDEDRLCVLCGGPSAVLSETFIYNICGDILCADCAMSQRSELETQDPDTFDGLRCPRCESASYYIANLEVACVMAQEPNLSTAHYVDLLLERQAPRVEQRRRDEMLRRRRLEQLRYSNESIADLLDSDDENDLYSLGEIQERPIEATTAEDAKPRDVLEYKTDIDELAKLFYIRNVFDDGWTTSAKVEACLDTLRDIWTEHPNDKVIVFSSFTALLDVMTIPLEAARIPFLEYSGKMDASSRNEALREFREGSCKVLLTSMKAGNVGLTLTQANRVIILEPFWNPYVEEQAQDRVYRIGQAREVTIYRIRLRNTVEDRIVQLQDKKREIIEGALDPSMKTKAQGLSRSDLMFALGLRSGRLGSTSLPTPAPEPGPESEHIVSL